MPTTKPAPAPKPAAKKAAPTPRLSTRDGKGGDGLACVQNIVANDRQTHMYLVQALYFREQARKAGRTNSVASAALDRTLTSYMVRQQKLRGSKLLKTNTDLTQWAKGWVAKVKAAVSGSGVGVLPAIPAAFWVGAVATVVVLAGTAAACWAMFHTDEGKSAADVKSSYEASEVYRNMSPEEQKASSQAVEDAGKGGFQDGKDAADNSLFGQLKTVLPWLVLGFAATQFANHRKGG